MSKLTESLRAPGNVHLKQEKVCDDAFFSLLALKVSSLEVARRSTVLSTWIRVACVACTYASKRAPKYVCVYICITTMIGYIILYGIILYYIIPDKIQYFILGSIQYYTVLVFRHVV